MARALYDALNVANISAFLDQPGLQVGDEWEPQLFSAANESQHIIVLWSTKTNSSAWVTRELGLFTQRNDPIAGRRPADELMIFVLLDGENTAYKSVQTIKGIKESGQYAAGFPGGNNGIWKQVVNDVIGAIKNVDARHPVPVAILAMTAAELVALDPTRKRPFADNLNQMLANIAFPDVAHLKQHYGASREDWCPFGQHSTIGSILRGIEAKMNALPGVLQFRWEFVDSAFWGNDIDAARAAAEPLLLGPSVVLIDPLSLHDDGVRERLGMLENCFKHRESVILALTPSCLPTWVPYLRQQLQRIGQPFFETYYNPPIPPFKPAICTVNVGDDQDLVRLLRHGLGPSLAQLDAPTGQGFTTG